MTDKKLNFVPQKSNVNKHTSYGLRLLEKSIQGDGFIDAQTAAADGEIISGSARIELAGEKFPDVEPIIVHSDGTRPVIVVRDDIPNANSPRARRLSVAANKIAQVDFDPDWALLKEWGGEDEQIKKLFSDDEWREGMGEEAPQVDAEPQIDRAAELAEKWQTASGQLWKLGDHRLLIGDCTVRENVERLMDGEKIEFIMADAPYNFEAEGGWTHSNKVRQDFLERIKPLTDFDPLKFFELLNSIEFGSVVFFCGKSLIYQYLKFAEDNKYLNNILVWCKDNPPPLHNNNFIPDLEYIIYIGTKNRVFENGLNYKDYSKWYESGIHEGKKEGDNLHPTIKPIALIERLVKVNSRSNVFDPFCGSGTTIIAAHNLNRRCFAMEISPAYGGVILQRFLDATGIQPELME